MAELLEFLLDLLDFVCSLCDLQAHWRFFFPVFGALGVAALIEWRMSNGTLAPRLTVFVLIAGLIGGIVWQFRGNRQRL